MLPAAATAPCQTLTAGDNPRVNIDAQADARIRLYFFWSKHCLHCSHALPFVTGLAQRYHWLELQAPEVNAHSAHALRYRELATALGQEANSVPALLYCGTMATGYDSDTTTGAALEQSLRSCHRLVQANGLQGWQTFARLQHDAPVRLPMVADTRES